MMINYKNLNVVSHFCSHLKAVFEVLRQQTELVAKEHQEASNAMLEAARRLNDSTNKHKDLAKLVIYMCSIKGPREIR